jgi:hypothetical protein
MYIFPLAQIMGLDPLLFTFVVIIIIVALVFDYINGFHDAANSIATIVSTRVLSPGKAVAMAAFFNFIAFVVLGEAVAKTIGKDMIDLKAIPETWQLWVLMCGLTCASRRPGRRCDRVKRVRGNPPVRVDEDSYFHRDVAAYWSTAGVHDHRCGDVDLPEQVAFESGRHIPQGPAVLGGAVQPGSWWQRRSEDHGHHRRRPGGIEAK